MKRYYELFFLNYAIFSFIQKGKISNKMLDNTYFRKYNESMFTWTWENSQMSYEHGYTALFALYWEFFMIKFPGTNVLLYQAEKHLFEISAIYDLHKASTRRLSVKWSTYLHVCERHFLNVHISKKTFLRINHIIIK